MPRWKRLYNNVWLAFFFLSADPVLAWFTDWNAGIRSLGCVDAGHHTGSGGSRISKKKQGERAADLADVLFTAVISDLSLSVNLKMKS